MSEQTQAADERLLKREEVGKIYGVDPKTAIRFAAAGRIPKPIYLNGSKREPRWFHSDIMADLRKMRDQ